MAKRPAFQFYPGDWLRDTALRSCSVAARGLWIDMIALMHDADPYGHLAVNEISLDQKTIARLVGARVQDVNRWLEELESARVFSRTSDGTIYSRRMVRDERIRDRRAAGGVSSLKNPNVPRPKDTQKDTLPPSFGGSPSSASSSASAIQTSTPSPRASALRTWLGSGSAAMERMAESADHGPTWESGIYGLYGPNGTDSQVWKGVEEPLRPSLLAVAIDRYAAEGKKYSGKYFRRFIERVIEEHKGIHNRNGNATRRKVDDTKYAAVASTKPVEF